MSNINYFDYLDVFTENEYELSEDEMHQLDMWDEFDYLEARVRATKAFNADICALPTEFAIFNTSKAVITHIISNLEDGKKCNDWQQKNSKLSDKERKSSERKYNVLFENSGDAIVDVIHVAEEYLPDTVERLFQLLTGDLRDYVECAGQFSAESVKEKLNTIKKNTKPTTLHEFIQSELDNGDDVKKMENEIKQLMDKKLQKKKDRIEELSAIFKRYGVYRPTFVLFKKAYSPKFGGSTYYKYW
jgi:hypothetical protein